MLVFREAHSELSAQKGHSGKCKRKSREAVRKGECGAKRQVEEKKEGGMKKSYNTPNNVQKDLPRTFKNPSGNLSVCQTHINYVHSEVRRRNSFLSVRGSPWGYLLNQNQSWKSGTPSQPPPHLSPTLTPV